MVTRNQILDVGRAVEGHARSNPTGYPWVEEVSEDRSAWVVRDLGGRLNRTRRIDLDIPLEDGSTLCDEEHREFFETAVEYLVILRLFMPGLTAEVHRGRVVALLRFLHWLKQRQVDSVADVSADHIELYAEGVALGAEWVLGAPVRLVEYLQRERREDRTLPVTNVPGGKLDRHEIMRRAKIFWSATNAMRICKKVLDWTEKHGSRLDTESPPEDVIERHGWKPEAQTVQSIHRALLPIEELWLWKEHFSNPVLRNNPFPKGAMSVAEAKGRKSQPRPAIPPEVAFPFLRYALKWVLDFGPIIVEERERDTAFGKVRAGLAKAGLEESAGDIPNEKMLMGLLSAACFVVIAGLSARRLGEIKTLGAGCTSQDSDDRCWVRIYIEKTLQDDDQIPIPQAVRRAVLCMEALSESAREQGGEDSIWQYQAQRGAEIVKLRPEAYINRLAALTEDESAREKKWKFSPHQFRRFFAMVYFWRYEPGDIAALSHHLRHFELEMTRKYIKDRDFDRIWSQTEREFQGQYLRGIVAGTRTVGGAAGQRLNKMIERLKTQLRKSVVVVPSERIAQKLLRLAKRWGTSCKMHVWGTICACPQLGTRKATTHAKCRGARDAGPVFSQASEETCGNCPFAIHTERFEQHLKDACASRQRLAAGAAEGTLLKQFARSSFENLEKALARGEEMPGLGRRDG